MDYFNKKKVLSEERVNKANTIVDLINKDYGLDCRERRRFRDVIIARQTAIFLIRNHVKDITLREIASLFPDKENKPMNHATIIHACNTIKDLSKYDKELRETLEGLRSLVIQIAGFDGHEIEKIKLADECNKIILQLELREIKDLKNQLNTLINEN